MLPFQVVFASLICLYHYWQHRCAEERRRQALREWIKPFMPLSAGLGIVLRLLRSSGRTECQIAEGGAFQMMLAERAAQMVRVSLKSPVDFVPEISANKYALNIRFTLLRRSQSVRLTSASSLTWSSVIFDVCFQR